MLSNVLDNAVKYSPKDPQIRVEVVTPDLAAGADPRAGQRRRHPARRVEAYLQALLPCAARPARPR